jgi:predicted nucleic acid-binding protein
MSERSFVDTNVLVYRIDESEQRKQATAKGLLEEAEPGSLVLSTQVLQEFYVVSTRKLGTPLSAADAAEAVEQLSALPVVGVDAAFVAAAIGTSRRTRISLWDALIVRAAVVGQCTRILTEDLQDGALIEGVRVHNPFGGSG